MTNLHALIEKNQKKIWKLRPSVIEDYDQEVYFRKAMLTIIEDKNLLKFCQSEQGAKSIFKCISDALQLGIIIGGQLPHAYIIGYDGKDGPNCSLIVTAEGYKFIALNSVLDNIKIQCVYEGEEFKINYVDGTVLHTWDGKTERGKIIGVYFIAIEKKRSMQKVDFMSIKEIEYIRDNFSKAYQKGRKDFWEKSFKDMVMKTAAKKFLKPYAAMKEGAALAKALNIDEPNEKDDIGDRVSDKIDNIIDTEIVDEGPVSDVPAAKEASPKEKSNKDLF
jgi:phage RecT family recombinase